jgi:hypothetical protein
VLTWPDGQQYTGAFKKGMQHGYGEWIAPDGSYYKGYWQRDRRHGQNGKSYNAATGEVFEGTWLEDAHEEAPAMTASPWVNMRQVTETGRREGNLRANIRRSSVKES